jgi:hypothetical protein
MSLRFLPELDLFEVCLDCCGKRSVAVLFGHHDLHIVDRGVKLVLRALAFGVRCRSSIFTNRKTYTFATVTPFKIV